MCLGDVGGPRPLSESVPLTGTAGERGRGQGGKCLPARQEALQLRFEPGFGMV